jgi:hypothetical protein
MAHDTKGLYVTSSIDVFRICYSYLKHFLMWWTFNERLGKVISGCPNPDIKDVADLSRLM